MNNLSQPYFNDIMVVCFINGGKHVPRVPGETINLMQVHVFVKHDHTLTQHDIKLTYIL